MGDSAGVLIFAPVLLAFPTLRQVPVIVRRSTTIAALVGVACLASVVFFTTNFSHHANYHLAFLTLLSLTWVALHSRAWPTAVAILLTCSVAVFGTSLGTGPFGDLPTLTRSAVLWTFVALTSLNTLLVLALQSEQEQAAAQSARAARDYGALVEDTPVLIVRFKANGVVTFANQTICTFLGESRDRVVGSLVEGYVGKKEWTDIATAIRGRDPNAPSLVFEVPIRRHDGVLRQVRWTGRHLNDAPGGDREYQTVGIDLTDQRESDEEKKAIESQLFHAQKLEQPQGHGRRDRPRFQ